MNFPLIAAFLVSTASASTSSPIAKINESYDGKSEKSSSTVILKNGMKFEDVGYSLAYIGELKSSKKSALLFRGVVCADCSADLSLFVQPQYKGARKTQFTYPGKVAFATGKLDYFRTFYGNCLPNQAAVLVNVKEVGKSPTKILDVWHLDAKGDLVFLKEPSEGILQDVFKAVKAKKCTEVPELNREAPPEN